MSYPPIHISTVDNIYQYAILQVLADNKTSMTIEELKRMEEMRLIRTGEYLDFSEGDSKVY